MKTPGKNLVGEDGWLMRSDHILTAFGLPPSAPIPPDYSASQMIGDTMVHIVPRGSHKKKRRVFAECNYCHEWVCAGHLHQHLDIHKAQQELTDETKSLYYHILSAR